MSGRIIPAMYSGAFALFHFRKVGFSKYFVRIGCYVLVSSLCPEGGGSKISAPVVGTYILAGFLFGLSVFYLKFNVLIAVKVFWNPETADGKCLFRIVH